MTSRVTRIEVEATDHGVVAVVTVERAAEGFVLNAGAPEHSDLPDDLRNALIAWAAGDQP